MFFSPHNWEWKRRSADIRAGGNAKKTSSSSLAAHSTSKSGFRDRRGREALLQTSHHEARRGEKPSDHQVQSRSCNLWHQSCSLCFPQLIICIDMQLNLITSFISQVIKSHICRSLSFSYNTLILYMKLNELSETWRLVKSLRPMTSSRRWEEMIHSESSADSWRIHLKSAAFVFHN